MATVSYKVDGVSYTREIFSSTPDQVIVMRIEANKKGKVNFTARMDSTHKNWLMKSANENQPRYTGFRHAQLALIGQVDEGVINFEARLLVSADGGEVKITDDGAEISNANFAILILAGASNFNNYKDVISISSKCALNYRK